MISKHNRHLSPTTDWNCRSYGYEPNDQWERLPPGWSWPEVAGVAVDRQDRVFVFNRGDHPVIIFDRDGRFIDSWGEELFVRAHGIFIGPDDSVYCTDDLGHSVQKLTLDGKLILTLGTKGKPSDTGATSLDFRTILRAGPPFHYPTNLALSPHGDMYVSDGYGNARVHKFSPDGKLLFSWGQAGNGPGEFNIPHGIAVDREGKVYVADRENSRIQIFSPDGNYLREWTDVARPCQIFIDDSDTFYVAELGFRAGMWPGIDSPGPDATGGRLSIFDRDGRLLARWGGGRNPLTPGDFFAPHGIWVDRHGDIYVTEVAWSAGGSKGLVPANLPTLQKFVRQVN